MGKWLNKRMNVFFLALVLLSFFIQGCGGDSNSGSAEKEHKTVSVKIIHINDHHSHLDQESTTLTIAGSEVEIELGGFARVVSKIKSLSAETPNNIILHAGDAISGTLYYTLFKGAADAAAMNLVNFDAMAVGNHEFDNGDQTLKDFIDLLDFPVISANVKPASGSTLDGSIAPYIIKEINGEKIGIIGLTIKDKTEQSSSPSDNITFIEEKTAVEDTVADLEELGVNKIILLSHYGYNNVRDLAREVRGIDVIVDGDSHTLLGDFDDLGLTASGSYPTMEVSLTGEPVCIVQAWQYSYVVGDLDVAMDKDGRVTSCLGNPVLLVGDILSVSNPTSLFAASAADNQTIIDAISANPNVEIVDEDTAVTAVISEYSEEVQEMKAMVIGRAGEDLLHNRIPGVTYNGVNLPLGSDIAPIVAKGFLELALRADVCIQNAGGVRISIEGDTDISYDTAYTLLPFANTLFEIEMYGSEIKSVLEDAVDFAVAGASSGAFPYSYGLRYDVNAGNEFGNRILNLEVRDRATGTWSLINENEMYVVVTNSFTASGQDGYTTFKTVQDQRGLGVDTFLDYAMSFVNYVEMETAAGNDIMKLPASEHPIKSYTPAVD